MKPRVRNSGLPSRLVGKMSRMPCQVCRDPAAGATACRVLGVPGSREPKPRYSGYGRWLSVGVKHHAKYSCHFLLHQGLSGYGVLGLKELNSLV